MNSITKLCELIEYYQNMLLTSNSQTEADVLEDIIYDLKSLKELLVVETR